MSTNTLALVPCLVNLVALYYIFVKATTRDTKGNEIL